MQSNNLSPVNGRMIQDTSTKVRGAHSTGPEDDSIPNVVSSNQGPALFLAPMDGVTDWAMRDTLSRFGGLDGCVTEFLRVTKNLHPNKVFYRHCPELLNQSRTRYGTPVYFQLLGGDAEPMALNAQRAAELGAAGIDLNFGCPAKTVNRHDGGAVLLKSPERLFKITKAVRMAVKSDAPVSAKIRLGYDDPALCFENAKALEEAGVQWITLHCRTKVQGYKPPADWEWVSKLRESLQIPVIANGDIKSLETFKQCQFITGAEHFMIGRAALSNPYLFKKIKMDSNIFSNAKIEWQSLAEELIEFYNLCLQSINPFFATARTKQWLKHLALEFGPAQELFLQIKRLHRPHEFESSLKSHLQISLPKVDRRDLETATF